MDLSGIFYRIIGRIYCGIFNKIKVYEDSSFQSAVKSSLVKSKVMSEEKKEVPWGYAYVLSESSPEKIIGRIMTLVEVIGLSETQEKSAKSLVRQVVREVFDESIYIKPERYAEIKNAYFVERALSEKNQVPMSAI